MGICTICSTKNMLDAPINEFYANMLIRKITCEKFSTEVKSNWHKGAISEENWNNKIVKKILGKDLDEQDCEEYSNLWIAVFKLYETRVLILAILLLCEHNQNDFKQRFKDLCRGILKFKDSFKELSDGLTIIISKEMLQNVLECYVSIISAHCLKHSEKVKEDDSQGRKDLERMYDTSLIKEYVSNFIHITSNSIKIKRKEEAVQEDYFDFDDFIENTYQSTLSKDIIVRLNLENYSIARIRETEN